MPSITKMAADKYLPEEMPAVAVREYDERRDRAAVEELERWCEVGQPGKPSLVTDLMGDPIARVRNFISHVMLVAEYGCGREIVGVIRGCIKTVTSGKRRPNTQFPIYVNLAYILGLRVSSTHRRLGIATKLVQEMEEWCRKNGAEYAYMATERSNEASLNLFTQKCNYVKFENPRVLVQPVHLHYKRLPSDIRIIRVPPRLAELLYQNIFSSSSHFFPRDIDGLLSNKCNLGTFVALSKNETQDIPPSFALLSIWDTKQVFRLQVKGVSTLKHLACLVTRAVDAIIPCLKLPSLPNVCKNFGFYFMYGLHMKGQHGPTLMKSLCNFAHNMARNDADCSVVVAEVGQRDPVRHAVPHWNKISWDEDVWCIKTLHANSYNYSSLSSSLIFVDPRDL